MLAKFLSIPSLFQWQQRTCNNYKNVKTEFSDFLQASQLNILDIGCSTGVCGQEGFDMRVASIKKDTEEKNSFGRVRRGESGSEQTSQTAGRRSRRLFRSALGFAISRPLGAVRGGLVSAKSRATFARFFPSSGMDRARP
jgi:hypothetical protein